MSDLTEQLAVALARVEQLERLFMSIAPLRCRCQEEAKEEPLRIEYRQRRANRIHDPWRILPDLQSREYDSLLEYLKKKYGGDPNLQFDDTRFPEVYTDCRQIEYRYVEWEIPF